MRWLFAIGTGAVIGLAATLALELSFRLMRSPAAASSASAPQRALVDPQGWPVRTAIVLFAIAFYTSIGYLHRPSNQPQATSGDPSQVALAPVTPPEIAEPATLDIGGVSLSFAPPPGSCLYPAPLFEAVKLQQAKVNPDNAIDAAFADCGQLRDAAANQNRIRDFGILMTPTADLTRPVDRAAIDSIAAAMPDATSLKTTLDQRLASAQSKLALASFSALGVIDRDPQAVYFAYLSKAQARDGAGFTQACVMAMTAINGRLVSYYLYSDYERDPRPVIFGLLAKVKAGVSDFVQRNRS